MIEFYKTVKAGFQLEGKISEILSSYTRSIYRNVRIPTLFSQNGFTEVDIIAAIADIILIVESKNISSIRGSILDSHWAMTGYNANAEYSALNVLTQNRIHVRSFKDRWYAERQEFPTVLSVVVVPDNCDIPEDLRDSGVLTISEFHRQVSDLAQVESDTSYRYSLDFFIQSLVGDGNG